MSCNTLVGLRISDMNFVAPILQRKGTDEMLK